MSEALKAAVVGIVDERLRQLGITQHPTSAAQTGGYNAPPPAPMPAIDLNTAVNCCFKCGALGLKRDGTNGLPYWTCPTQGCGYDSNGRWVQSKWDITNWQERKERADKFAGR